MKRKERENKYCSYKQRNSRHCLSSVFNHFPSNKLKLIYKCSTMLTKVEYLVLIPCNLEISSNGIIVSLNLKKKNKFH